MMRRLSILFVAAGCALCAAQSADPIVNAICGKTQEQLQSIVDQAAARGKPIEVAAGADKDTLAAAVYASAVAEAPGGGQKTWPGCGSAPEQAAKPAAAAKPSAEAGSGEMWAKMSEMLFKTQDKDGDGKLSPTELKKMIDQTNAAAKAQGVADAEVDFFKAVDKNSDGFADRSEIEAYFKAQLGGMKAGGAGAAGAAGASASGGARTAGGAGSAKNKPMTNEDMHEMMFKNLDKNGDGSLSMEEMKNVIEKVNQQAANQEAGESGEDFFKTIDGNGDGSIDREEAKAFFAAAAKMTDGAGASKKKDEV